MTFFSLAGWREKKEGKFKFVFSRSLLGIMPRGMEERRRQDRRDGQLRPRHRD